MRSLRTLAAAFLLGAPVPLLAAPTEIPGDMPVPIGVSYSIDRTLTCVECGVGDLFFGSDSGETVSITGEIVMSGFGIFSDPSAIQFFDLTFGGSFTSETATLSSLFTGIVQLLNDATLEATPTELIFSGPDGASLVFSESDDGSQSYEVVSGSISEFSLFLTDSVFGQGETFDAAATSAVVATATTGTPVIPLPTGLPLVLTGLAALGLMAHGKRAA